MHQDVIEHILKHHALRDAFRAEPPNSPASFHIFLSVAARIDRFRLSWTSWPSLVDHLASSYEACFHGIIVSRGALDVVARRWLYQHYPTDGLTDGCPDCGCSALSDVLGQTDCPDCSRPLAKCCRLCLGGHIINVANVKTGEDTMICPCQRPNWPRPSEHSRDRQAFRYVGTALNWI